MTARIRLALARGEASSDGAKRKMGHMRASGDCVRQRPQPLHEMAMAGSLPPHAKCNSSGLMFGAEAAGISDIAGGLPCGSASIPFC